MFLMLQDMAVPHILVAASPRAGGNSKWHGRQVEVECYGRHFARMHLDSLFPAKLVWLASTRAPVSVNTPVYHANGWRDNTWQFARWKWIGCVSAVRLYIRQTSTVLFGMVSVGVSRYSRPYAPVTGFVVVVPRSWVSRPYRSKASFSVRSRGTGLSVAPAGMLVTLAMLRGWGTPAFTIGVARNGGSTGSLAGLYYRKRLRIRVRRRQLLFLKYFLYQVLCRQSAAPCSPGCRENSR